MNVPYSFRLDEDVPPFDDGAALAVMDAECAICSWGARMIHRLDKSGTVRICPVQTPLGEALLRQYGLSADDPSSWLFIDKGVAHTDFDAVIHAGRCFGGLGRLTSVLRLLPKPLRWPPWRDPPAPLVPAAFGDTGIRGQRHLSVRRRPLRAGHRHASGPLSRASHGEGFRLSECNPGHGRSRQTVN